ncbi:uncharacterized protein LOC143241807 [Tachypleus tridentatus]|uniref:uncharacterized protein LOC143241807 n=1 Tax=Tachypleus tridentatus TaxID=6853 RepID=UPI003FD645C3
MLLCIVLMVYLECVKVQSVDQLKLRIVVISWVVPASIVVATLVVQALKGFHFQRWWLTIGTTPFYTVTTSTTVIFTLHFILFMMLKTKLKERQKLDLNPRRKELVNRSTVILLSLLLATSSSILYVNNEDITSRYYFALSSTFLGTLCLFLFVAYDKNCRHNGFCRRSHRETGQKRQTSNTFKMYVRPEVNCNRHHNLDMTDCLQKRAERINRMRSEIERAEKEKQVKPYNHTKVTGLPNLYISKADEEMTQSHHPVKSYQGFDDILCFERQETEVTPVDSRCHGNDIVHLKLGNSQKQITLSISEDTLVSSDSGILGGMNSLFEFNKIGHPCSDSTNLEHEFTCVHLDQAVPTCNDVFTSCGSVSATENLDVNREDKDKNSSSL